MNKKDVTKYYGGVKEASEALGIWPHTFYRWENGIPIKWQCVIEVRTNGKLKADRKLLQNV